MYQTILTNLQQSGQEGDEIRPFVNALERLQTAVHLGQILLVLSVGGKKGRDGSLTFSLSSAIPRLTFPSPPPLLRR